MVGALTERIPDGMLGGSSVAKRDVSLGVGFNNNVKNTFLKALKSTQLLCLILNACTSKLGNI